MKKIITIITTLMMVFTITACSPVVEKEQSQTSQEVVETTAETTTEAALITKPIQGEDVFTEENLERGQELAVMVMENLFNYNKEMDPSQNLAVLESHFHSKTASKSKEFIVNNAKTESYVTPTMNFKERYIAELTIPEINGGGKTNAFNYTFTVNRIINGKEQGIENISVLFMVEDGEFKLVGTYVEES